MLVLGRKHVVVGGEPVGTPPLGHDFLELQEKRRGRHRDRDDEDQEIAHRVRQDIGRHGGREQDERELAALAEEQPEAARGAWLEAGEAAQPIEDQRLRDDERRRQKEHLAGVGEQDRQIHRHADGREEQAEQQPLERLQVRFELMAIGAFGEKSARDESPERRREPRHLHQHGHADDGQQPRRRHGFLDLSARDEPQHLVEREMPDQDHRYDGPDAPRGRRQIHAPGRLGDGRREQGHEGDQRDGGQILKQEDREAQPSVPRSEVALLLHELQRECRGRESKDQADEQRRFRAKARDRRRGRQDEPGQEHLRAAEPENSVAHRPEPLRAQLEPDQEQEQHDPELRQLEDLVGIVRREEVPEDVGSEQDTRQQVPEHRADAEAARQGRRDGHRSQQQDDLVKRDVWHL